MTIHKAITVWQPYASFLAWGEKKYETRKWQPKPWQLVPGDIVMIHAGVRRPTQYERRLFDSVLFKDSFRQHAITTLDDLPYGAIIAAARFVFAHPVELLEVSSMERLLGDYSAGRFAWELEIVKVAETPIKAVGQQGIWKWEYAA